MSTLYKLGLHLGLHLGLPKDIVGEIVRYTRFSGKLKCTLNIGKKCVNVICEYNDKITIGYSDGSIVIWNGGDNYSEFDAHKYGVRSLTVISEYLVSGGGDGTIKVWNSDYKLLQNVHAHTHDVVSLTKLDNNSFASGSGDSRIKIWKQVENSIVKFILDQTIFSTSSHRGLVDCLTVIPHKEYLISGGFDNTIKIWNKIRNKKEYKSVHKFNDTPVQTLKANHNWIECLVVINTNNMLLGSGGVSEDIKIWNSKDKDTFKLKQTLLGNTGGVLSLDVFTNEDLVSGGGNGTIKVWRLNSKGNYVSTSKKYIETPILNIEAHTHNVFTLLILKSEELVSGGGDGIVNVWW